MNKFHIQNNWHLDTLGLLIKTVAGDYSAAPITFERRNQAEVIQPCLQLSREEAQELLDELYRAGLRPSKSFGDVDATRYHLEDMRKLVFENKRCHTK